MESILAVIILGLVVIGHILLEILKEVKLMTHNLPKQRRYPDDRD